MGCIKVNAVSFAKMLDSIQHRARTFKSIGSETGLHPATVGNYIREMHKLKLVHISGWEQDRLGRDCIAIYTWGFGVDKPRHKYTAAQRQARHRAKQLQEEKLDEAARRTHRNLKSAVSTLSEHLLETSKKQNVPEQEGHRLQASGG